MLYDLHTSLRHDFVFLKVPLHSIYFQPNMSCRIDTQYNKLPVGPLFSGIAVCAYLSLFYCCKVESFWILSLDVAVLGNCQSIVPPGTNK